VDANRLPAGITKAQLDTAILASGYPLQTTTAVKLATRFDHIEEEWTYIDVQTSEIRALDLLAERRLWATSQPRVMPELSVLIECKQSELPYVFFKGFADTPRDFPILTGLRKKIIQVKPSDDRSTWQMTPQTALSLPTVDFAREPDVCSTLSRVTRRGSSLELSGSDTYNSVVLPLVKALKHFEQIHRPKETFMYLRCIAILAVAVLDAPMVLVELNPSGHHTSSLKPWIRLTRHEAVPNPDYFETHRTFVIDFVHADFVGAFLDDHVAPFADEFRDRVLRHPDELYSGKGRIDTADHIRDDPEQYLRRR
jgi:hypothetical protein